MISSPARGGCGGLLGVWQDGAQENADSLLSQLALGGLGVGGEVSGQVRPKDRYRVVSVAEPLLGMEDLLRGTGRIGCKGVVQELLASFPAHL